MPFCIKTFTYFQFDIEQNIQYGTVLPVTRADDSAQKTNASTTFTIAKKQTPLVYDSWNIFKFESGKKKKSNDSCFQFFLRKNF